MGPSDFNSNCDPVFQASTEIFKAIGGNNMPTWDIWDASPYHHLYGPPGSYDNFDVKRICNNNSIVVWGDRGKEGSDWGFDCA